MNYTLLQLISDVMGRVGETAQPSPSAIPAPADIIALKIESLLPEVGAKLLRESPLDMLGEGMPIAAEAISRLMPCGLYAAEVALPEDFVRFVSAKMEGWRRSADHLIYVGDAEWSCQWSEEAGIAGCPSRPRAYIAASSEGRILRLMGSEEDADVLEWLRGWSVPCAPEFHFPAPLYPQLIKEICKTATELFHAD